MFFIYKKNNSLRLCIDYKKLNIFMIKNKYLFSLIDEMLKCFISTVYVIKLDFKNIYY